jgi:hypothetical protein
MKNLFKLRKNPILTWYIQKVMLNFFSERHDGDYFKEGDKVKYNWMAKVIIGGLNYVNLDYVYTVRYVKYGKGTNVEFYGNKIASGASCFWLRHVHPSESRRCKACNHVLGGVYFVDNRENCCLCDVDEEFQEAARIMVAKQKIEKGMTVITGNPMDESWVKSLFMKSRANVGSYHDAVTKQIKKDDEERGRWFLWIKKTILRVKNGIDNPVYLIRYSLLTTPWFALKLHRIYMSDDDCLHDHPWSFISIILWGGYVEHRPDYEKHFAKKLPPYRIANPAILPLKKTLYGPGSIIWRKAPSVHKLEVFQPATTLVITFKRQREWGFWTMSGWKLWSDFIRSGRKCE